MTEPNRLQLVMGMEFNECSIASAELAGRVQDIMDNPDLQSEKTLFLMQGVDAVQVAHTVVPVSDVFENKDGRDVQFYLTRQTVNAKSRYDQTPRTYLMAVTRGDIAFTVASFARRQGQYCDYVQIGEEITNESLVVTPKDEQSRKDVVEAMRRMLNADPTLWVYKDVIADARRNASEEAAREAADIEYDTIFAKFIYENEKCTKKEAEIRLAIGACNSGSAKYTASNYTATTRSHYKRAAAKLNEFFANPSFRPIIEGKVPGSHDLATRRLLIKAVADKLYGPSTDTNSHKVTKLSKSFADELNWQNSDLRGNSKTPTPLTDIKDILDAVGINQKMNESLGKTNRLSEELVSFVGKLASMGSDFTATKRSVDFNSTKGDVELFVKVKPSSPSAFCIDIFARPSAMEDREPSQVYGFVVNRCVALDLSTEDVAEVSDILHSLG